MDKLRQLMDIDRLFCEECQTDKEKAWMRYTAEQSVMGTSKHHPYITDRNKIEQGIKSVFELEDIDFTWEPKHAFISDDETLGVTTGVYTRKHTENNEEITTIGKYCTTWKKFDDEWKIVLDIGN